MIWIGFCGDHFCPWSIFLDNGYVRSMEFGTAVLHHDCFVKNIPRLVPRFLIFWWLQHFFFSIRTIAFDRNEIFQFCFQFLKMGKRDFKWLNETLWQAKFVESSGALFLIMTPSIKKLTSIFSSCNYKQPMKSSWWYRFAIKHYK